MNIVVFGPERRVGLLDGARVIDLNKAAARCFATEMNLSAAAAAADRRAPSDLAAFISAGQDALHLARNVMATLRGTDDASLIADRDRAGLVAPWPGRRIFCAGANYPQHVASYYTNLGSPRTPEEVIATTRASEPVGFTKNLIEVMGPGDDVIYPSRSTLFDYEAEVAIIIGTKGKDIPPGQGGSHIWGITLANDWSDRNKSGPGKLSVSFNLMKNFDCSLSLGPSILVGGADPQNIDVTTRVNGELRQDYNSRGMIYSFAEYIQYLSIDYTLVPGDVVLGGTDWGTATDAAKRDADGKPALDLFLKIGDIVEIASPGIGTLTNRIIQKQ